MPSELVETGAFLFVVLICCRTRSSKFGDRTKLVQLCHNEKIRKCHLLYILVYDHFSTLVNYRYSSCLHLSLRDQVISIRILEFANENMKYELFYIYIREGKLGKIDNAWGPAKFKNQMQHLTTSAYGVRRYNLLDT